MTLVKPGEAGACVVTPPDCDATSSIIDELHATLGSENGTALVDTAPEEFVFNVVVMAEGVTEPPTEQLVGTIADIAMSWVAACASAHCGIVMAVIVVMAWIRGRATRRGSRRIAHRRARFIRKCARTRIVPSTQAILRCIMIVRLKIDQDMYCPVLHIRAARASIVGISCKFNP